MSVAQPPQRYTPEEYLRRERDAVEKHEYYQGEIFAMAGGSAAHSNITTNAIRRLSERLDGSPCEVYDSNLRIRIPRTTLYTYPDLSVICGPPEFDPRDERQETVVNPSLIIEVLSPTTEAYDRGAKFDSYRSIASLREYLLLSQTAARAETFLRQADGSWLYRPTTGLDAIVQLAALNISLPLAALYAGVSLPPPLTIAEAAP